MPKFIDGYQTTLGSRFNTNKLTQSLNVSIIQDRLLTVSLDVKKIGSIYPVFVTPNLSQSEDIPLFPHPFYFRTRNGERIIASDMRFYLKKKVFDGTLATLPSAIMSQAEYQFARAREILNLDWAEQDNVEAMRYEFSFATLMFTRWISDLLSKAYALDARDQIIISIVSSYYYQSLFVEGTEFDAETLQKWKIHTAKVTNADSNLIDNIYSKMPAMKNVESLIEGIQLGTENIRLKDLNLVVMLTLMKNSWYGTNSKEIISVAIEHPPTWMSIVYASLKERTFRSSLIYKIAERVGKRGISDEYLKKFDKTLSAFALTETHIALAHAGLV